MGAFNLIKLLPRKIATLDLNVQTVRKYFLHGSVNLWNSLLKEVVDSNNVSRFKKTNGS